VVFSLPALVVSISTDAVLLLTTEVCDNALDDDSDGLIDLNDPDCDCILVEPESLIPNPSFEDMNCCPTSRSQLNCSDVWIQASEPTTDYLHTCGWMGWDNFPPPLPFPDGEAIMGFRDGRNFQERSEFNWKEYAGACLKGPLKANEKYRFQFYIGFVDGQSSPPIDVTFYGTADCNNLPFGVGAEDFGCPTNGPGWVRLGSRRVSGFGPSWLLTSIDVTPPDDIHAIAIGPSCLPTSSAQSTYYFFDNLVLDDLRSFEFVITPGTLDNESSPSGESHPCSENFTLMLPEEEGLDYQWYKDGIALLGETSYQLSKMHGDGDYQVVTSLGGSCNVTKEYNYIKPTITFSHDILLCAGEHYNFGSETITTSGDFTNTFISQDGCDSTVILHVDTLGMIEASIDVKIFEGELFHVENYRFSRSGTHDALLMSAQGCDSLLHINLAYYKVYIPNIFSPNGDGQNDYFNISETNELQEIRRLKILDRWGQEVFDGKDLINNESNGWDGLIYGRQTAQGVYRYVAQILMDDGKERVISGDVMVVR